MKKIVVVVVENVLYYPPVISLVHNLLNNGNQVTLISKGIDNLPEYILEHHNFKKIVLNYSDNKKNIFYRFISRIQEIIEVRKKTVEEMKCSDILWTCSLNTIRDLQKDVLKYKNVLQMMELYRYGYSSRFKKFPLEEIARKSWKNVVPEENRAYIEKAWWKLKDLPYVLPNKPYCLEYGELDNATKDALKIMKEEKRKIILYLGGIFDDREFEYYARALQKINDKYVLYIVGKAYDDKQNNRLKNLIEKYNVIWLGHFDSPQHLAFIQYSYIGLLPYRPLYTSKQSELNALYCAPNKIFEYAGYGIPMIGSNVLGLKYPFEKWNIGMVCNEESEGELFNILRKVNNDYSNMASNCNKFYNNIDLDKIVKEIIC